MDLLKSTEIKRISDVAIVDGRVDDETINNLKKYCLNIIKTIKCSELYDAISYHPDIVIHPIDSKTVVVAPNVYDYYKDRFYKMGIKVIQGEKRLKRNYPDNIAYNVARVGRYVIHNFKYTDEKLKYYYRKMNFEFINVNQGYTKCSIAIVNERAIITSDPSIYKECVKHDIDVLHITEGFIELPGLNYGFIGGATGNLDKDSILFSGSFKSHPDYIKIIEFLKKYDKIPIILSNNKIKDIGSIITLNTINTI